MSRLSFSLSVAVIPLFSASTIFAGGIYLTEIGTPLSLGTTGVGNVVNNLSPDAAFTNPAGMTGLRQDSVLGGVQALVPIIRFDSDISESGGSDGGNAGQLAAIPSFFMVKKLPSDISVGLALLFGVVYRSEADLTLEGDLKITNISNPVASNISSGLDSASMDLNYAQMIAVGMRYKVTDQVTLLVDFDWEDWSALGEEQIQIGGLPSGPVIEYVDFQWKDTYHAGGALVYKLGEDQSFISTGLSYDSSPVDDKDRTFLLPVDEQIWNITQPH